MINNPPTSQIKKKKEKKKQPRLKNMISTYTKGFFIKKTKRPEYARF
jgi:hypothetical protein